MGDFTIRADVDLDVSKVQSEAKQLGDVIDRVVNTKLGGKDSKLGGMQNQLLSARKQAEKLSEELTNASKVPTPEYQDQIVNLEEINKEIQKYSSIVERIRTKQDMGLQLSETDQAQLTYYNTQLSDLQTEAAAVRSTMSQMRSEGTAFTLPDMTNQAQQLSTLNDKVNLIISSFRELAGSKYKIGEGVFDSLLYPADQVRTRIQELSDQITQLGKQSAIALTNMGSAALNDKEVETARQEYNRLTAEIERLTTELSTLSAGSYSMSDITSEIENTKTQIHGLATMIVQLKHALEDDDLSSEAFETMSDAIDSLNQRLDVEKDKLEALQRLKDSIAKKPMTVDTDKSLMSSSQWANAIVSSVKSAFSQTVALFKRGFSTMSSIASKLGNTIKRSVVSGLNTMKSALQSCVSLMRRFASTATSAFSGIVKGAKNAASHMRNHTKETQKSGMSFKQLLTMVLKYGFGIRSIYFMVRKLRAYVADGFSYLYKADEQFKSSIDSFKGSLDTLKLAITGAFEPLVTLAIPYLQKLIGWLISAVNAVAQFIAALTGKTTYKKAITQTKSLADRTKELTKEQKENAKASKQQLSGLDKLNNLTTPTDSSSEDPVIPASDLWEDAEVDSKIKDLADKFKAVAKKLFAPIKRAWDEVGQYVKDQWKYMWSELGKLGADILRDFLRAWDSDLVQSIWEDIFTSLGNIFKMVGNLARQFREAWNTNEVGYNIFVRIFELLKIISGTVKDITASLAEWAGTLDFYPLLASIERLLDSMKGPVQFICDSIKSFVEDVFEPFVKYLLEIGVPKIFKAFENFNRNVNWNKLTEYVKRFNKALEPLLELSFEAFVKGLNWLLDALAKFLNGNFLGKFVDDFEDFVKALQNAKGPMDVIDAVFGFFNKRMKATLEVGNSIVKGINNFLSDINAIDPKTGSSKLKEFANNFSESINTILSSIEFKDVGALVSNLTKTLLNFFTSVFEGIDKNEVKKAVQDFLTGIDWVGVFNSLKDFILSAAEILTAVKDGVLGALKQGIDEITPAELGQKVGELVHNLFTSISDKLSEMRNDGTLSEIGHKIGEFITGMNWNQIFTDLGNLIDNIWTSFKEVLASSLGANSSSWSDISDKIGEVIGGLPWDQAWQKVKDLLKGAIQLLFDCITNIVSNNPEMAGDLAGAFAAIFAVKVAASLAGVAVKAAITEGIKQAIAGAGTSAAASAAGSSTGTLLGSATASTFGTSLAALKTTLGTSVTAAGAGSIAAASAAGLLIGGEIGKGIDHVIGTITGDEFYEHFSWFGNDEYGFFKNVKDFIGMKINKTPFDHLSDALAKVREGSIPTTEQIDKMAAKYEWTEGQVKMLDYAIAEQTGTLDQWKQKYGIAGETMETTTVEMEKAYGAMGDLGGEVQTLTKNTDAQKTSWSSFWSGLGSSASNAWASVRNAVSTGWNSITTFFSNAWKSFTTNWTTFWTGLGTNISTAWSNIKTSVSTAWNNITTFFTTAYTTFTTSWNTFWNNLGNNISTTWSNITTAISTAWNNITTFFSTSWATLTTEWNNFWTGLGTEVSNIWTQITTGLTNTWNELVTFFTTAWATFTTSWSKFWTDLSTNVSKVWTEVKTNICNIWTQLKTTITTVINDIKTNVTTTFTNLKTTITSIFTGMWNTVKGVINSILGGVEKMANGVINGIDKVIGALNNLHFDIPDWVPEFGGKSFGFNIPTLSTVSIPRLAQGTVVPPRMGEFAAILGDNKRETEVVSPLSTMKQAMLEAIVESGMLNSTSQGGDTIVNIDGKEVFRAVRKQSDMFKRSNGVSAFV